MHRLFGVCHLVVFGALAAFTNNFDITEGLSTAAQDNQQDVEPSPDFRTSHLSLLNSWGLSIIMGCSRFILCLQYCILAWHAYRLRRRTAEYEHDRENQNSKADLSKWKAPHLEGVTLHIGALLISTAFYFGAFGVVRTDQSPSHQIAKIVFWFFPFLLELTAHLVVSEHFGDVIYSEKGMVERSATLFTIFLGSGLDKITNKFQYIVGTVGFGAQSVGLMISAAMIILGPFSLYFSPISKIKTRKEKAGTEAEEAKAEKKKNTRFVIWFFFHFVLLACLIMTLLSTSILLSYGNLSRAVNTFGDLTTDIVPAFNTTTFKFNSPPTQLDPNDFSTRTVHAFTKLGTSFDDFIEEINQARNLTGSGNVVLVTLQDLLNVTLLAFSEFNASPNDGSLLSANLSQFLSLTNATNPLEVISTYNDLFGQLIESRVDSALWFFGVAGGTLMSLGILPLIKGTENYYQIFSAVVRIVLGFGYAMISILDREHSQPFDPVDASGTANSPPKLWAFASGPWILPSFAIVLLVVNFIEGNTIVAAQIARSRRKGQGDDPLNGHQAGSDEDVAKSTAVSPSPSDANRVSYISKS